MLRRCHCGCHIRHMSPRPSFPMHFHLYHFTIARTRRLRLCGQRRRACGAQQPRVDPLTVWWCSALSTYSGLYGALSPVDPLTVWWCSALSTYFGLYGTLSPVDPLTVWWCSALSTYSGLYGTLSPVDPLTVWWCSALSTYFGLYGTLSPTDS